MLSGRCHDHPERAGIGICVECRHVVCQECTTQVDGINRCASCLRLKARTAATARPPLRPWSPLVVFLSTATLGSLWGLVYVVGLLFARR